VKTHALYPLQFHPVYRTAPWGGDAIARHYNRAGTPRHCAESWELSALPGTESIVQNGAFEGIALSTLAQTFGWELTGHKAPEPEVFPLLIKILDAHDALSVQVHPDAEASRARGVRPKREMWYVLEAEPGAKVWAGVEPGADFDALVEHLHAWEVTAGDVLDLPPGIVHAVGAGNLIYEVQQASDAAYRIYDWGRSRPVALAEARSVARLELEAHKLPAPTERPGRDMVPRLKTPVFAFATLHPTRSRTLHTTEQSFMVLSCASGKVSLGHSGPHPLTLFPGDTVLVPPRQTVSLQPLQPAKLLVTTL